MQTNTPQPPAIQARVDLALASAPALNAQQVAGLGAIFAPLNDPTSEDVAA